ncbi:MAG: plasmid mobilization protein [Christensenellales bacterium]
MSRAKRRRGVPLYVWVSEEEHAAIGERMAEAGTQNLSAYIRKMALNGYVLNVDLSPVRELVSLQRRCANNLNQIAIHANTYGVYPQEIAALQKDYAELWERVSDVLKQLAEVTVM